MAIISAQLELVAVLSWNLSLQIYNKYIEEKKKGHRKTINLKCQSGWFTQFTKAKGHESHLEYVEELL